MVKRVLESGRACAAAKNRTMCVAIMNWNTSIKVIATVLFALVFLPSCSRTTAEKESQSPLYPDIEVYMLRLNTNGPVGSVGDPNLRINPHGKFQFATQDPGEPPYQVELQYVKSNEKGDRYRIKLSVPVGSNASQYMETEIYYPGKDTEIFKDERYNIGIRPKSGGSQ